MEIGLIRLNPIHQPRARRPYRGDAEVDLDHPGITLLSWFAMPDTSIHFCGLAYLRDWKLVLLPAHPSESRDSRRSATDLPTPPWMLRSMSSLPPLCTSVAAASKCTDMHTRDRRIAPSVELAVDRRAPHVDAHGRSDGEYGIWDMDMDGRHCHCHTGAGA